MLEQVHRGVLDGRVVERGDVPEVHQRQPRDDPGGRARERAEPALQPGQPPRSGAHDHARERQQEQQRRDVAEQHVLDHVRREQVVLAEAVER